MDNIITSVHLAWNTMQFKAIRDKLVCGTKYGLPEASSKWEASLLSVRRQISLMRDNWIGMRDTSHAAKRRQNYNRYSMIVVLYVRICNTCHSDQVEHFNQVSHAKLSRCNPHCAVYFFSIANVIQLQSYLTIFIFKYVTFISLLTQGWRRYVCVILVNTNIINVCVCSFIICAKC